MAEQLRPGARVELTVETGQLPGFLHPEGGAVAVQARAGDGRRFLLVLLKAEATGRRVVRRGRDG